MDRPATARTLTFDLALAAALAFGLTVAWTISDWSNLSALRLPDTDDGMRLQQIRDWLAGQPFADLAQHRLGAPPGLEMHWSRLPDLVPAAIIAALRPLVGTHWAQVAAVIAWPAMLFAAAVALVARIARALGGSGATAAAIAALAYPATAEFMPGRIDHHGLQLIMVLIVARALVGVGSLGWGVAGGLATAGSLAVGLETAPVLAVAGAVTVLLWATRQAGAEARLGGFALALAGGLAVAAAALRTSGWDYPACDGFDAQLWRAAQLASLAPLALAAAGGVLRSRQARLIAAAAAGIAAMAAAALVSPACLHPYGAVDALLARLWLADVAEAQPLLSAPPGIAIGYGGLAGVGLVIGVWIAWRTRAPGWAALAALQLAAVAVTLVQLRGAYAAALLAAPALAALVTAARARGAAPLVAAWLASAGLVYPLAGDALPARGDAGGQATVADCTAPTALARIAALPPGRLLAPIDLGAFALAATHHSVVAAPYHRNDAGNRAMYAIFLARPAHAEALVRRWRVETVAICADSFAGQAGPASLAAALRAGRPPAWLTPLSRPGDPILLYALTKTGPGA